MTLRSALDDYKRTRNDARVFPGERRTTTGTFSGLDERLVYVDRDGWHRDHTYPVSGLSGVNRSRFGIELLDGTSWLGDLETVEQGYVGDTALVRTVHDAGDYTVTQHDLTLGAVHLTRFELKGELPTDPTLQAFFDLTPEHQETRLGKLEHEDTLEVHHHRQANLVTATTEVDEIYGQLPEQFDELLTDTETVSFPREKTGVQKYEDALLNGTVVIEVPFEVDRSGAESVATTTVASLLADLDDTGRKEAVAEVTDTASEHDTVATLRDAAEAQVPVAVPEDTPRRELAVDDLRVLSLLAAETGAHIAGPDPDPFYAYTGGYGYTWFRDDSEIARYLLETDERLDTGLEEWFADSAAFYMDTQLDDGSWPHRVWAHDGTIAPGWAHARLESGDDIDYQADQTGSVASFLSAYLRLGTPSDPDAIESTLELALDGLDSTLEADGLPIECQNAWENMTGRFVHTAATFLQGYAAIARAPVEESIRERALEGAKTVYEGLDELWVEDEEIFALRIDPDGDLDPRLDTGSLALAEAHREYAAVASISDRRINQLAAHFEHTLEGLWRETDAIAGLYRFEGDEWRRRIQDDEKIWTVSTAWGANACTQLASLLADRGDARAETFYTEARRLFEEIDADGSLVMDNGYLPEQLFDDGTPDCATPLGWPHAIRLATVAQLATADQLDQ
ncbi:glycoside hydrolase family 15 protein [Halapricum hydrolyticum]|uniref:Glucan 1,4-alpha-glucosidase n=1 Tax=Halapricum hydrolyticum TaxID=2979991 RepID=A0AAE3I925_9EURY|nr:glycoside hydrolase family 15 protein [Halapricum hydrolyticum]MCU4717161.1 glucan 1,4-alpha-glucosidase [Halapricum hydrolyticum]MCU4726088.1 glucan 1,4-alpha-glucosidase [Halapricum hydrolyticum]